MRLDAPLGTYLTDYPNPDVARKVTIHHLLTHTGGTGDTFGPEFAAHREQLRSLEDYVALYGNRAPLFEPGSRWQYSNYGFVLLGRVLERVSGQSYFDYVAEHGTAAATSLKPPSANTRSASRVSHAFARCTPSTTHSRSCHPRSARRCAMRICVR